MIGLAASTAPHRAASLELGSILAARRDSCAVECSQIVASTAPRRVAVRRIVNQALGISPGVSPYGAWTRLGLYSTIIIIIYDHSQARAARDGAQGRRMGDGFSKFFGSLASGSGRREPLDLPKDDTPDPDGGAGASDGTCTPAPDGAVVTGPCPYEGGGTGEVERRPSQASAMLPKEENNDKEEQEKYVRRILNRLRSAYPEMQPEKATRLAETLVDHEKTKRAYFKHLLVEQKEVTAWARKEAESDADAYGRRGYRNAAERREAQKREAKQLEKVGKLQVRLLLYELNQDELKKKVIRRVTRYLNQFEYGPFHSALLVGDVLLDWDIRGVVIPRRIKSTEESGLLVSVSVHPKNEFANRFSELDLRAEDSTMFMNYTEQLNTIVELGERREVLIDELARVTVLYNQKFDYGIFSCNCQRFVVNVLKVLGIENYEGIFQGKLRIREHTDLLIRRGNAGPVSEFNSHAELDDYVRENIDRLDQEELEFCHCHYLLFHAWQKKQSRILAWQCPPAGCCFTDVNNRLL